jgi:FtsZ-binding cell division protein ZapB
MNYQKLPPNEREYDREHSARPEIASDLLDKILCVYDASCALGVSERAMFEALLAAALVWADLSTDERTAIFQQRTEARISVLQTSIEDLKERNRKLLAIIQRLCRNVPDALSPTEIRTLESEIQ